MEPRKFAEVRLIVNDVEHTLRVPQHWTLLRVLRDVLGYKSVKETCGVGECGACTVIKDGKAISSCLELAIRANGSRIETLEGLPKEELHPLQIAFMNKSAFQCGFCSPGMIMMAKALLDEKPNPTTDEIREYMSGNLCRCTGYWQIVEAIQEAASLLGSKKDKT